MHGVGFWVYKYSDLCWPLSGAHWDAVYQTNDSVVPSRRWEACRDGQEDFRMLFALRRAIEACPDAREQEADAANALMAEAVEKVAGWQVGRIDEIARNVRDYEVDYVLLRQYRKRIAEVLVSLRVK